MTCVYPKSNFGLSKGDDEGEDDNDGGNNIDAYSVNGESSSSGDDSDACSIFTQEFQEGTSKVSSITLTIAFCNTLCEANTSFSTKAAEMKPITICPSQIGLLLHLPINIKVCTRGRLLAFILTRYLPTHFDHLQSNTY